MSTKKFGVYLSLAELYAIRNSLAETGKEATLLDKVNRTIKTLHDYFDGRTHHLCLWDIK